MRIFIGMETSGRVREAMRRRGHEVVSCDLLPSEDRSPHHIIGDVMDHVLDFKPDLAIFHPTCTRMTHSSVQHLFVDFEAGIKDNVRWEQMQEDARAFRKLLELPIDKIAIENPKMHGYAISIVGRSPDQIVHPYWFGDDASKQTGLWLKGLPRLVATAMVAPRMVNGLPRWANQTDSGQNNVSNTKNRWRDRSVTFPGVAHAFATQWTSNLLKREPSMKFTRYQIQPVIEQNPGEEQGFCEALNTEAEWQQRIQACKDHDIPFNAFWTIYGYDEEGHAHAICDWDTKEVAFEILEAMLGTPRDTLDQLSGSFSGYKMAKAMMISLVEGSSRRDQFDGVN